MPAALLPVLCMHAALNMMVPYYLTLCCPARFAAQVLGQLTEIGESDVFEELDMLESTDLSNVEYMPAYLNKRLNNRLWSRRKALGGGY